MATRLSTSGKESSIWSGVIVQDVGLTSSSARPIRHYYYSARYSFSSSRGLRCLFLIFFAGIPKYTDHGSVDFVIMLHEPTDEPSANITPGKIMAPAPTIA